MQDKQLVYHFDQDSQNQVVFDQPLYYEVPLPKGGTTDQFHFTYYSNGAFINNEGYFFNNLGFDRYGRCYDEGFEHYFRVDPKEIQDKEKVEPPPRKEVKGVKQETKELVYHSPEDEFNEVVFDQPYKYNFMPKGGEIDDNDFLIFENGAFITDDGFYFNNLGFDRYGGRLDESGQYFKVKAIKIKDKDQVEDPPAWDPREEDESQWKQKGLDDKNSTLYEKKYRGDQDDEYDGGEPGDDMFVKRPRFKQKGQKKEEKKEQKKKEKPTGPKTVVNVINKDGTKQKSKESATHKAEEKGEGVWDQDL